MGGSTGAEPYVARWPVTAKTLAPDLLALVLVAGWLALRPRIVGHSEPIAFWVLVALAVVVRAVQIRNGRIALDVGPVGVRLGQRATALGGRPVAVPWRSIAELVVLPPRVFSPADLGRNVGAFGVRLRPDAPLPAGLRGIIREPSGVGPLVTRPVEGWTLDRPRLLAAVSAYAPGVRVVDHSTGA